MNQNNGNVSFKLRHTLTKIKAVKAEEKEENGSKELGRTLSGRL